LTGAAPHRIPPEQFPRGRVRPPGVAELDVKVSWQSLEVAYLPPRRRCLIPTTPSGPTEHHGHPHAARRNTCTPPGIRGRCINSAELVPRWLRAAMASTGTSATNGLEEPQVVNRSSSGTRDDASRRMRLWSDGQAWRAGAADGQQPTAVRTDRAVEESWQIVEGFGAYTASHLRFFIDPYRSFSPAMYRRVGPRWI
jgi:hypothetical protein